jgi:CubicO group peptidase (beta-lactamase class C family)
MLIDTHQRSMCSFSISMDGKEVYSLAIGFSDVENSMKANTETVYRIGSVSKIYTAAIILQMVNEGKLSLDITLDKFYPDISNATEISIEQLLRHRSGLFNFTNDPAFPEWMETPKTREQLLELFVKNGVVFSPGDRFEYSNTNYVLLSYIAEKVDGTSFSDIVDKRIVKPLGLTRTKYGGSIKPTNNEAQSYTRLGEWLKATETDMSIPTGAGALASTPREINSFMTALFHGNIVPEELLEKITTLQEGYGLGMMQFPFYEKKAYGHTGGIDGFQAVSAYFPREKVAVSLVVNGAAMQSNDILLGALSIFFGREYELPEFKPEIVLSEDELTKFVGAYGAEGFPMKIIVTSTGKVLQAQATGQPMFPLEAFEKDKFRFDPAGIVMDFIPDKGKVILHQGGSRYELTREYHKQE